MPVATSSFTLNFTEESSVAVVSSLITARRLWLQVQAWSVKVPTTKRDEEENWLLETAHVNWSDSECVSAVFLLLLHFD